jgi:hypothetical protein
MAIKGLSLAEKEPYILKDDPGHPDAKTDTGEKPTIFYLGNLTQADRIEIGDITMTPTMSNTGVSMSMQRMKRTYITVQRGLKGWENFTDEEDKPIPFEESTVKDGSGKFRATVKDECMMRLTSDMIFELGDAILKKNGMTKELAKNSDTPSSLSLENLLSGGIAEAATENSESNEDATPSPSQN